MRILDFGERSGKQLRVSFYLDPSARIGTPYFKSFLWPQLPEFTEPKDGPRIVALSVRESHARRSRSFETHESLVAPARRFFGALDGVYGYCGYTEYAVTNDCSVVTISGLPYRVDYSVQIDGIHPVLFLSQAHVRRLADSGTLHNAMSVVSWEPLQDRHGAEAGALVRVNVDSNNAYSAACRALGPLLPTRDATMPRAYLLFTRAQVERVGSQNLSASAIVEEIQWMPDGAAVILEPAVDAAEGAKARTRELTRICAPFLATARGPSTWAHEYTVQHAGLFQRSDSFQRHPERMWCEGRCTEVFTNDPVDLNRVSVQFLSMRQSDPGQDRLDELLSDWLRYVSEHPDVFGTMRVLSPLTAPVDRDRICRVATYDLSESTENALIALLLLIDDRFAMDALPNLLVLGAELPWRTLEENQPRKT